MEMLDDLNESENGVFKGYSENHNWTQKNCLWKLPYAKALILPHNVAWKVIKDAFKHSRYISVAIYYT
jgi:hypothetical protein